MSTYTAFSSFSRVTGRYNTLGMFVPMSGVQQRVTGNDQTIDVNCYHSKMYTTQDPVTLSLGNGIQDGQLKKMTFVFKGTENANIVVECPSLFETYSEIVFSEVGDFAVLLWTGGNWVVLETGNTTDPTLQPMIQ
jgi:hypothetical protein